MIFRKEQAITAIKEALAQTQEPVPPPWWPAVENILTEYGLQAIDFVADFKQALAQTQEPVAHWSDCSVHSEPAYPKGECDCGGIVAVADYTALSDKYVALSDKYVALKTQRTEQLKACVYCGQLVGKEKNT